MNNFFRRFIRLVFGLFLFALGVVIIMKSNLGFVPWEVFHAGIAKTVGMTIGTVNIIIAVIICVIVVYLGEEIGLGSVLNMILMGSFIDLFLWLNLIPQAKGFISGTFMMLAGLFTIAFGSYFYINSAFGTGPRDGLMVAIKRKTKFSVGLCRGIVEFAVVFMGWLLGGPVGIGTVLSAFGMGFCIQIVFNLMKFEPTSIKHETLNITLRNLKEMYYEKALKKSKSNKTSILNINEESPENFS